jgi:glycosyltransferase involved in cell wall biosynthesis
VISSTAQVYFNSPSYPQTYEPFLGPNIVPEGTRRIDDFTLHRLPLLKMDNMPGIAGLGRTLEELNPDVIQTFDVHSDSTYDAAEFCKQHHRKLFTASHLHASVFRLPRTSWKRKLLNSFYSDAAEKRIRFISSHTVRCYPIAPDAAKIVIEYFKVPVSKICVQSLGVDTSLFHSPSTIEAKEAVERRRALGFNDKDFVCIYTGRFAQDKNPQCLAQAIGALRKRGEAVFGMFIGYGTEQEIEQIRSNEGCVVQPFIPVDQLRRYYWMADIGVWPSQESTSQLDAMACGLPVILSDRIEVLERVQGNGLLYREADVTDLMEKISEIRNPELRKKMSVAGIEKIRSQYSWESIARARIQDYSTLSL